MRTIFILLLLFVATAEAFSLRKKKFTVHSIDFEGHEYLKPVFPISFATSPLFSTQRNYEKDQYFLEVDKDSQDTEGFVFDFGTFLSKGQIFESSCFIYFIISPPGELAYPHDSPKGAYERYRINCTEEADHKTESFQLFFELNQTATISYSIQEDPSFEVDHYFRVHSLYNADDRYNTSMRFSFEDPDGSYTLVTDAKRATVSFEKDTVVFPCIKGGKSRLSIRSEEDKLFDVCEATSNTTFYGLKNNLTGGPFYPSEDSLVKVESRPLDPIGATLPSLPAYAVEFSNFTEHFASVSVDQRLGNRLFKFWSFDVQGYWSKGERMVLLPGQVEQDDCQMWLTVNKVERVHMPCLEALDNEVEVSREDFTVRYKIISIGRPGKRVSGYYFSEPVLDWHPSLKDYDFSGLKTKAILKSRLYGELVIPDLSAAPNPDLQSFRPYIDQGPWCETTDSDGWAVASEFDPFSWGTIGGIAKLPFVTFLQAKMESSPPDVRSQDLALFKFEAQVRQQNASTLLSRTDLMTSEKVIKCDKLAITGTGPHGQWTSTIDCSSLTAASIPSNTGLVFDDRSSPSPTQSLKLFLRDWDFLALARRLWKWAEDLFAVDKTPEIGIKLEN